MNVVKNLLLVALLILIGGVGYYFYDAGKSADVISQLPTVFEQNQDDVKLILDADGTYNVSVDESSLSWQASKTLIDGYTDRGVISLKSGVIEFDDGVLSSANVVIDMTTIQAVATGSGGGEDGLSSHLKSDDFFEVETYSEASFELSGIEPYVNDGFYEVEGDLTIKGITNPISFIAEIYNTENEEIKVLASVEVDRTKWNVQFGSGFFFSDLGNNLIDDIFLLDFELIASKN